MAAPRAPLSRRVFLRGAILASGVAMSRCAPAPTPLTAVVPPDAQAVPGAAPTPPLTPPSASQPPATIVQGTLRVLGEAGLFLALERGYFDEEGLQLELVDVTGTDQLLLALSNGQLTASTAPVSAAIFNAVGRGIPVKIVAPLGTNRPGASANFLMVRAGLVESGQIAELRDIAGHMLAKAGSGTVADYGAAVIVERAGLPPDAVGLVEMRDDDAITALRNAAVDLAFVTEPLATVTEDLRIAVKWKSIGDLLPGLQPGCILFGPDLLASRPEVGRRWMRAYLRGVRDYDAAMGRPSGRQEVGAILARHTPVRDLRLYNRMGFVSLDPGGRVDEALLSEQLAWYREQGLVTTPVDLQQILEPRFARDAAAQLGP